MKPRLIATIVVFALALVLSSAAGRSPVSAQSPAPNAPALNAPSVPAVTPTHYPSAPAYDSGWVPIAPGQTLTLVHNLGGDTDDYVVDLRFSSGIFNATSHAYNQAMYGGNQIIAPAPPGNNVGDQVGAYWHSLTNQSIKIKREPQDTVIALLVRVRIWVTSAADWDSGWVTIDPGIPYVPTFDIGNAYFCIVYMEFKATTVSYYGVHQRGYGGLSSPDPSGRSGAYWRNLTNTSILVFRRPNDVLVDQVRLRIWYLQTATFDSGWETVPQGGATLQHDVGGNPADYIVDVQFKDTDASGASNGVNQRCYGTCDLQPSDSPANTKQGAYWDRLNESSIHIARAADDLYADQVRVRIWNIWTPHRPTFDSGWRSSAAGATHTLQHNLAGSEDDYMVNLIFRDSLWETNQMYYGVKGFGTNQPGGYADYESGGAHWSKLTNSSLDIFRPSTDRTADEWRVRMWRMPKPDYDSAWRQITAGASSTFNHDLTGNPYDFLVDLSFYDDTPTMGYGKNQIHFGGSSDTTSPTTSHYKGAYWDYFTTAPHDAKLIVWRQADDTAADWVRVRIWRINTPTKTFYNSYDPGQTRTLTHNLNSNSEDLLVDATASLTMMGEHKRYFGRMDIGAQNPWPGSYNVGDRLGFYWYLLDRDSIVAKRMEEDVYAETITVRIWQLDFPVYLPLIRK